MIKIAFFGLGNMGEGMAINLVKAGFDVTVYDLVASHVQNLVAKGAKGASNIADACHDVDAVITMLPAGSHVEALYFAGVDHGPSNTRGKQSNSEKDCIVGAISKPTLFIDCSTIESTQAIALGQRLKALGHTFIDAPVSGGVAGAAAGTLTFIVGGASADYQAAHKILQVMGKNIFHAGPVGAGQVAKICNNMLLAVLMAGTSEALNLAVENGLDAKVMSQIMLQSSGRNWTLELYNPCPDVMPNVPSSNDYEGGFMVDLMNKDLGLALQTAGVSKAITPMGALAKSLYQLHAKNGYGKKDFSSIYKSFSK